jgi:hypothetical protein
MKPIVRPFLARLAAWATRRANFRFVLVVETAEGVWHEMMRLPGWFLAASGEPFYPEYYPESDARVVRLDIGERRIPRDGVAMLLVDTRPDQPRPARWTDHDEDDD